MITGAAAYGYVPLEDNVVNWEAHPYLSKPYGNNQLIKNARFLKNIKSPPIHLRVKLFL